MAGGNGSRQRLSRASTGAMVVGKEQNKSWSWGMGPMGQGPRVSAVGVDPQDLSSLLPTTAMGG